MQFQTLAISFICCFDKVCNNERLRQVWESEKTVPVYVYKIRLFAVTKTKVEAKFRTTGSWHTSK